MTSHGEPPNTWSLKRISPLLFGDAISCGVMSPLFAMLTSAPKEDKLVGLGCHFVEPERVQGVERHVCDAVPPDACTGEASLLRHVQLNLSSFEEQVAAPCAPQVAAAEENKHHGQAVGQVQGPVATAHGAQQPSNVHKRSAQLPHQEGGT